MECVKGLASPLPVSTAYRKWKRWEEGKKERKEENVQQWLSEIHFQPPHLISLHPQFFFLLSLLVIALVIGCLSVPQQRLWHRCRALLFLFFYFLYTWQPPQGQRHAANMLSRSMKIHPFVWWRCSTAPLGKWFTLCSFKIHSSSQIEYPHWDNVW